MYFLQTPIAHNKPPLSTSKVKPPLEAAQAGMNDSESLYVGSLIHKTLIVVGSCGCQCKVQKLIVLNKLSVSPAGGWRSDIKMLRKPKSLCHFGVNLRSSRLHSKRFTYKSSPQAPHFSFLHGHQVYWTGAYFHKPILTQSPLPRSYLQINSHAQGPTRSRNLRASFFFAREHSSVHTLMTTEFIW